MARITLAGESLIAQKQGAKEVLHIARFIYANVPGLDPAKPIDRAAAKPPAMQIVHTYEIPAGNSGYVNPNQVVYSSMLGSDVGDFDWNWLGLESAEGVLFAVACLPLQQKRRNIPPLQIGNNITRNILVEYSGAQELTGITIDASTWQHDFTVRLAGIDERERMSNRDIFGRACFFNDALQVIGTPGKGYQVKAGVAYVEGVRILAQDTSIAPTQLPTTAWLDVVLERQLSDVVARWKVVFEQANTLADYRDVAGVQHYCIALADLTNTGSVDRRRVEPISGPLIEHFASRQSVTDLVDGTTAAGKAKQLATARIVSISGAASGSAAFDGSKDTSIHIELNDTGIASGTYTKVQISKKGLVESGGTLQALDIPSLDWSKITSGKPTTLGGYGITDAATKTELSVKADKATTLNGYGITDAMRKFAGGIESQAVPSSPDLNSTHLSGLYSFHTLTTNRPAGSSYGTVAHNSYDQATGNWTQFAVATNEPRAWYRGSVNGAVQPWAEVWSSANLRPETLQAKLGFTPVQQGTGIGQLTNTVKIGWNATDLKVTVDSTDLGTFLLSSNCDLTGAIVYFPFNAPPNGFLRANGAAVSRVIYARLFARIGTMYGVGDGSTTFNVPDGRAVFPRGLDDGRGLDPGRTIGSTQLDQLQGHAHAPPSAASGFTVYTPGIGGPSSGGGLNIAPQTGGVIADGFSGAPRVGAETRPINLALLACIKY
ncbi:phage tail-collar fiber domain-containing protein [Pseudomonas piscis]